MTWIRQNYLLVACCLLPLLYFLRIEADSIAGLFGVLWSDEGPYLLPAKMQVLYGKAHLFPEDRYLSEFTAPLLHRYGLLMMTKTDTVALLRWGMGFQVLLGQLIIARLAWRYHGDRDAGLRCLLILMLTPLLYFYGRVALTEGMQFLMVAMVLWALYELWNGHDQRKAYCWSAIAAMLIVTIFLSKVTSIGVCVGLTVATLTAVFKNKAITRKWYVVVISGLSGCFMLAVLYWWWLHGHFDVWLYNIFGDAAYNDNMPNSPSKAVNHFVRHYRGLQSFLALMPIFSLGFAGLILAADSKRGYLWLIWLATIVTIAIESVFPGELRRSFFELSLMMILAGFTIGHFLNTGLGSLPRTLSRVVSYFIVALFCFMALDLSVGAFVKQDITYIFFSLSWLAVLSAVLLCRGEAMARMRRLVLILLLLTSLMPMLYQAFFTKRTIGAAIAMMEKHVPEDSIIAGPLLPWMFQGLKRQIVFTNCAAAGLNIANDPRTLPKDRHYFFVSPLDNSLKSEECLPANFDTFLPIKSIVIFYPYNRGHVGGSNKWLWYLPQLMFEQPSTSLLKKGPQNIISGSS